MDIELSEAERVKILNSDDLFGIMQRVLLRENKIDQDREHFWVLGLATNHKLLFVELISLGSVNKTIAEPMEVFSLALQKRAVKVILCHNHPSGELKPSDKDKDLTDRLIQVGIIVDTEVLDHIIISERSYLSFADSGLMDELKQSTKWVPRYKQEQQIKKETRELALKAGKEAMAKDVALRCLQEGMDVDLTAKLSGLSIKVVEGLKKKMK